MGIVTALATAIFVAVTGVNCVEVIHTKAILCYDDTMMRHWKALALKLASNSNAGLALGQENDIQLPAKMSKSMPNFRSKWLEYPILFSAAHT